MTAALRRCAAAIRGFFRSVIALEAGRVEWEASRRCHCRRVSDCDTGPR